MKRLLLLALLAPLTASAESPFDGTWVTKTDSLTMPKTPLVISLDKGTWRNDTTVPPVKTKGDGTDQPVSGHAYFDMVAVKSLGPDSMELTTKKAGKVMFAETLSVSADGKTLTRKWSDQSGSTPVTGETTYTRLKSGPAGSNAISGSWEMVKVQDLSANGRTVTYKATANGLAMSTPTGQSYDASFDGKYVATAGDPGQTMVSLKRLNSHTIVETDMRLGKVTEVDHMTVSADGKVLKVEWHDKLRDGKGSYEMAKAP